MYMFSSTSDSDPSRVDESQRYERLALIVSYVLNAPIIAFIAIVLMYMIRPSFFGSSPSYLIFIHSFVFMLVFPMIAILVRAMQGHVDLFVKHQKDRILYYASATVGYLLGALSGWVPLNSPGLILFNVGYCAVTICMLLVNQWEKASVHVAGVTGPITLFVLVVGPEYIAGYLLVAIVAWARLHLKAHSALQIALGFIVGLTLTVLCAFILLPFFHLGGFGFWLSP
ncbi:MAG: hypothetical protein ACTSW4_05795 [Candidatus Ranarchaeia archaeon]